MSGEFGCVKEYRNSLVTDRRPTEISGHFRPKYLDIPDQAPVEFCTRVYCCSLYDPAYFKVSGHY